MAGAGSRPVFGVFSILLASRPMAFRRAHILILERRMISKKTKGVAGLRKNCSAIARFWQTMLFLSHGGDKGALRFLSGFSLCRVSAIPSLPFPRPAFRAFHVFSRSADFSQAVFMLFFFFICYRRFFSLSFFSFFSLLVLFPCLSFFFFFSVIFFPFLFFPPLPHCFLPPPPFFVFFFPPPPPAPLPA